MKKGASKCILALMGVMCSLLMVACGDDEPIIERSLERVTGDTYQDLSSPLVRDAERPTIPPCGHAFTSVSTLPTRWWLAALMQ